MWPEPRNTDLNVTNVEKHQPESNATSSEKRNLNDNFMRKS